MQPGATKVLAVIQSAPITTTMNWTLMTSDNLYTECYLRTLGAREKRRSGSPLNAQELGLARVNQILSSLGVDTNLFRQVDGSGLSRYNLVSPAAMIETLKAMDATKYGQVYKSFLPVAGVSGSQASVHQYTCCWYRSCKDRHPQWCSYGTKIVTNVF
jgi:serine-type D-Ala-D-Ala carboxypeptidase/endopeptidase (penicillin-binding protein 4)